MLVFAVLAAGLSDPGKDAELIGRLKNREPQAMTELYDRYGRIAYSLILRVVRNTAIAEDLTQETFLRAWNRSHLIDAEHGSLGPWLLTIARNRAIDYLRSIDARFAQASQQWDATEDPRYSTNVEPDILNQEYARKLKAAFGKLSEQQQKVIELAYYEGLSQSEMAEHLQQPLGTVKTWVRTALKTLREELGAAAIA